MATITRAVSVLSTGTLVEGSGADGPEGLSIQMFHKCPIECCEEVHTTLSPRKSYAIGCTCRGGLFSDISIRRGAELLNKETIEAFIRQTGVALQRRHLREKLRKAEARLAEMEKAVATTSNAG